MRQTGQVAGVLLTTFGCIGQKYGDAGGAELETGGLVPCGTGARYGLRLARGAPGTLAPANAGRGAERAAAVERLPPEA